MAAAGCWWCLFIMNNPVMMHLNHPSSLDALALVDEVGVQASSHSNRLAVHHCCMCNTCIST